MTEPSTSGQTPTVASDRYRAVGLAGNPFATSDPDRLDEVFVPRGIPDPPPPGSGVLVQVIGEQGAGKSTHVLRWRRSMPGPYHYVPRLPYRQRWQRPPVGPIVYADEIDRMPIPLRRRWFRACAKVGSTVVAGTHADLTPQATRAELAVRTHHLGPVDRATLVAIVNARLRAGSLPGVAVGFSFTEVDLTAIHERSAGSVREAEVFCHELLAERVL